MGSSSSRWRGGYSPTPRATCVAVACASGRTTISSMFTCFGRVTAHATQSAMSSPVSGVRSALNAVHGGAVARVVAIAQLEPSDFVLWRDSAYVYLGGIESPG